MESRGRPSWKQKLQEFSMKDEEKLAEAEIGRLQKQFRIAAEKRKSYGANVRRQMQAQEKEMESLTQEHKDVSLMLSQLGSLRNEMLDNENYMELQCLLQTRYQYDSLIRERKAKVAELDNQILELEEKIVRQHQRAGKGKQAKSSTELQKRIESLEMSLNTVTVHFGTILTRNNKLREEIESLRIQKAVLDSFYVKLQKELDQQRRRMSTALEHYTQAYEQRYVALQTLCGILSNGGDEDGYKERLIAASERGFTILVESWSIVGALLGQAQSCVAMARNTNPCTYTWSNLLRSVCRTEALANISALKKKHREETVELQKWEHLLDQEMNLKDFTLTKLTDRSELEEEAKKEKALKAAQRGKQSQWESVESREVTYRHLLELAEDGDFDRLVNDMIAKEAKNFASFVYVSELNDELDRMQQRIKDLQNEIAALVTERERAESSRLPILKELEAELLERTEEANWYEERCKQSSKVLGQLKSSMEALCKGMNYDTSKITEQLGGNGQITDLNLMQVLGLVEQETNNLLLLESELRYLSAQGSDAAQPFVSPLLGSTGLLRAMDRAQLCPPAPSLDSTSSAIDACECVRQEGGPAATQPANPQFPRGCLANPLLPRVFPGQSQAACPALPVEVPLDHGQLRELILQSRDEKQGTAAGTGKNVRRRMME
ncbi:coiled-coil domain-containing protein 63-like [Chlamydotis macqueenii]